MNQGGKTKPGNAWCMLALSAFGGLALSCARPIGSPVAAGDASGGAAPAAVGNAISNEESSSPAPVPPPSSLAELAPVMRAVSNAGSLLDRIIIEFARDVVNKAGDAPPGTEIRVTPGVEGATLHYIRPHTLVLRLPEGAAFANHTRYEVTLEAITVGSGETIKAAAGEAPVYVFTTPPFGLERVTVTDFDARASTLTFDMAFTGPVDTQEVKESVSIQVAGDEAGLALIPQENPGVVRLRGTSRRFRAGESLLLQVGALSGGSPRREIPPSTHRIEVPQGPELQIYSAHMSETSSGFVIHIVCNDEGAGKESMYHWDPHVHEGWEVSSRCELHANALSKVHLSPDPGAISISPSRGGFDLQGDFKRGTYQLRIDAGAHSVDGGQLHGAFEGLLQVPARSSSVEFSVQGRYLPRDTWTKLPLRHLNVPRISLSLRHVPAENLVFWMSGDSESADARTSEFISSKTIDLEHAPDAVTTTWVDLSDLLPRDRKGVFELRAQGRSGRSDARRLVLTDMNLVAKRTESEVQVWTFGIHDNAPLPGAQVRLVTRSGQELSRCLTDAQGGCRLTHQRDAEAPTRERFAVIATRGDDVSYLKFADVEIPTDQADVSGASYRDDQSPYKAALYTDRGVYRPGETVHIVSVLREQNGGLPPSQLPVTLLVHDSRDKLVSKQALATQSAGLIAYDLALESFAATGKYKVVLKAAEIVIGSLEVQVEEFVPERMRVNVQAQQREAIVNELTSLTVDAQYLFGGSAAGSPVEVSCDLEPASFRAPDFAEYAFDVWRPQQAATKPLHLGKRTGTLDGEGALEVRCPSPEQGVGLAGASRLRARASVFEAGSGRTTVGEGGFLVHPARHYIGLKSSVDSVKVGESFRVEGVVVDWDGKPVEWNEPVKVSLHRVSYSYGWTYNETDGSWSNRRHQRVTKAAEAEVRAKGGKFTVELNAIEGASLHLVRAEAAGARTDLSMEGRGYFYAWDYGWDEDRGDDTPRPARPASLRLSVPEEIVVGQRSAVTLKVPFPGRLLMTVESDEILHHEWREVQSGETSIEFELKKFIPNVYVSALLLKDPHLESQEAFLPARAFAVTSVRVAPSAYVQPLAVNVPAEVRSNSTLQVELDVNPLAGDTFVTVAAVDEGILQLTKFKTPDPLAAIFERRRLEVHTFDTVGWNLNLPAAGNSRRHGGDEGAGVGRVQPVRPVALFSGIMAVPASGKLTIPLEVPEYRGALRVMAIVVSGAKVGRAEAEVKVRDPIVLQATLPRTLLANDEFDVPVSLTNLSGRVAKIKVFLRAEDMLDFSGEGKAREDNAPVEMMSAQVQNIVVADKATAQVVYRAKVRRPSGAIRLVVEAESDAGRFRQTQEIPLGARGSRTRETKRISITERSTDLAAFIEDYEPLTERTTVRVTSSPWGDVFEHLRHLIRYPYGCVEQTASTTRPLLFLGRIAGEIDPEILKDGGIEARVQRGIQRLFSMQTPTGGFAYWPGGSEPTRWASAYVVHLLLDAQELGYPFPASRLDDALRWMEQELTFVAESDEASRNTTLTELRDAEPYMHYVLARAGRGRKGRMQQLLSRLAQKGTVREEENRYLLQAGLWRAGDRRYEAALRALDLSPLQTERYNDWSYLSDSRRRGLTLTLYGELFGRDAAAMPAADMVADMLRAEPSEGWSTQELVWGITGLGRQLAPANAGLSGQAILVSDGRPLKALPVMAMGKKTATSDRTFELYRASEKNSLRLEVPSADVGKGWVVLTTEGVKRGAVMKTGGDGLVVSRAYYDEKGNEALLDNLALGDLLFVVLTAENKSGRSIQNLALIDRLPAGFEIENPRLGRGHGADLIDESQLWQNDHLNVRDDRLEVFGHLNRGERKHVVYQVRAVTAGDFHAPPVELEAMYDPSLWARAAGGQVQVRGPWGP